MVRPRILVVGGVAAGASAAARARRMAESAEIVIFERGEEVSFANCGLPYYIAGQIQDRKKLLVAQPADFREKFRIEVHTRHEVVRVDRQAKQVEVVNLDSGQRRREAYDKLVLAPGASPVVPPWAVLQASNLFTLRDMTDSDRIRAYVDEHRPARAVVIGAGFIGLEMVEALTERGAAVTLVELQPQVLPLMDAEMASRIEAVLRKHKVDVRVGVRVNALSAEGGRVTGVRFDNGEEIPADLVLVSVGVRPNVELAREAGLRLGPSGGIAVDELQRTSDPDICAAGDATEVVHAVLGKSVCVPLAGPANRNGRLAGQHAVTGKARPATPVAGSAIVGVFGEAAAVTGLSLKAAKQAGLDATAVYAIGGHHAGYYPGAEQMVLKLVFDPASRRVLGAQAVGGAGVDKRIDVIATAIRFGGTIDDLAGLDLTYAPQFGSAKDPVHIAAFVAQNQADGLFQQILPGEPIPPGQVLDVRTTPEVAKGTLPGAVHISLQTLRDNLNRLDRDRPVLVLCGIGQRAYFASRILMQSGFGDVWTLAGGYTLHKDTWPAAEQTSGSCG
ncbi:MAG: FAD-dependent oxidoreductase [Phycisphaerae bacterium]|nr:FAD-dependent oxidoreductase [Phycisphaerae bacterium]